MKQPFVSCIMPTSNRQQFIPYAIDYFLHQDYQNSELIIFDDGKAPVNNLVASHPRIRYYHNAHQNLLGTKRNFCCEQAKGEIIVHLDDDDWYAEDWISKQVNALLTSEADITGLNNVNFFITNTNNKWEYRDAENEPNWAYGATLAYWKTFWNKHHFKEMNTGEDNEFISRSAAKIYNHDYTVGYLGIIHGNNSGIVPFQNPREKLRLAKWMKTLSRAETRNHNYIIPIKPVYPFVTCIMPTANRAEFIPAAIDNFLRQDYFYKELVIVDDGLEPVKHLIPDDPRIHYYYFEPKRNTGAKRNLACERANGELIMHWDDDDWYASDWINYQVILLVNSDVDLCGINQVQFYSPTANKYWMTKNSNSQRPWLTGASLIYRKSFWEKHPFKDLKVGEDDDFIRNNNAKVLAHDYYEGFVSTLHPNNTSLKFFEDPKSKTDS